MEISQIPSSQITITQIPPNEGIVNSLQQQAKDSQIEVFLMVDEQKYSINFKNDNLEDSKKSLYIVGEFQSLPSLEQNKKINEFEHQIKKSAKEGVELSVLIVVQDISKVAEDVLNRTHLHIEKIKDKTSDRQFIIMDDNPVLNSPKALREKFSSKKTNSFKK